MNRRSPRRARTIGAFVAMTSFALLPFATAAADDTDPTSTSSPGTTSPSTTVPSTTVPPATTTTLPSTKPKKLKIGFMRVVLSEQRVYVYNESRRLVTTLPVSTGLWDSTPPGSYRVFSKSRATFYTPNPEEKMRWMVRFAKGRNGGNIGFHGIPYKVSKAGKEVPFPTPLGKAPSSHGCVRMKVSDAKWLYDNTAVGTRVVVVRTRA